MIWGLGPHDQPSGYSKFEGAPAHLNSVERLIPHTTSQAVPRMQWKRATAPQFFNQPRTQVFARINQAKTSNPCHLQPLHRIQDDRNATLMVDPYPDVGRLKVSQSWMDNNDGYANDSNTPVADGSLLDLQLAILHRALKKPDTKAERRDHPDDLQPIIPVSTNSGFSQSFPRIFVEPREADLVDHSTQATSNDFAHHQHPYQHVIHSQQFRQRNCLPTPPDSSSPLWSSHFSPYDGSISSPEVAMLSDVHDGVDPGTCEPGTRSSRPQHCRPHGLHNNINQRKNVVLRHFWQHPVPSSNIQRPAHSGSRQTSPLLSPPAVRCSNNDTMAYDQDAQQAVFTPPSPDSPQLQMRNFPCQNLRSIPLTRLMQRRLPSVPEESGKATNALSTRIHNKDHQHHTTAHRSTDVSGSSVHCVENFIKDQPGIKSAEEHDILSSMLCQVISPAKVRLPPTKEQGNTQQRGQRLPNHYENRKKLRGKKIKGKCQLVS